ncbi:karyogamy protein [Microthyrium microscopicum]|uniref:Karyogamy protein n=1 Tax=Microthyrium microscopicum TaxID=703497 RepID=A0A6A6UGM2_9PEZI|nr:karyogamy protein [Microthyrium microscopicum]
MLTTIGKSRGSSRAGFILEDGRAVERDRPPSPPPKDPQYIPNRPISMSTESLNGDREDPYFNPYGLQRTGSIYTLSRASLSNQLQQLTSIKLPDSSSLESSIASIPTSVAAAKVLNDAAHQIRIWIKKANEVLETLDAEDDVEWAAAAGREGLGEVDTAINVFERLIIVFVNAIENLESRPDIQSIPTSDQTAIVDRMEKILEDWEKIKSSLNKTKEQVEIAMEFEELWNTVLGEIGMEQDKLSRLIFEMEERRHKNSLLDAMAEPGQGLDIKELETIVEEAPGRAMDARAGASKISLVVGFEDAESAVPQEAPSQEVSNLLALTARMQPLRASLDFLPMRLAGFLHRGKDLFPSACEELDSRMQTLEARFKKLQGDAEALRKELGEDRWVLIFRKAGRQALKMCESVERSVAKLRESLDEGIHHTNPPALTKKIENYEAKREHYGPAIQQVLAIIDRGVSSRLTVNGEILRLQADMQRRWADIEGLMKSMDFALDQLNISRHRQLRDSVSTVLSEQRSIASSTGTLVDTPGSSPASSIVLLNHRRASDNGSTTPFSSKSRQSSFTSNTTARGKRMSSLPTPNNAGGARKIPLGKASASNLRSGVIGASSRLYPPPTPRSVSRQEVIEERPSNKPRWNSSTNTHDTAIGHNFKPLSATTPSPYRKGMPALRSPRSFSHSTTTNSTIPSPLGPGSRPASAVPPTTPLVQPKRSHIGLRPPASSSHTTTGIPQSNRTKSSSHIPTTPRSALPRGTSFVTPGATPHTPGRPESRHFSHSSIASSTSTHTLTERNLQRNASMPTPQDTPSSSTADAQPDDSPSSRGTARPSRPGTAMALGGNRRQSLLPQPKRAVSHVATAAAASAMTTAANGRTSRSGSTTTNGRNSRMGRMSSLGTNASDENRPKWRG